jgi:hypothetical protein
MSEFCIFVFVGRHVHINYTAFILTVIRACIQYITYISLFLSLSVCQKYSAVFGQIVNWYLCNTATVDTFNVSLRCSTEQRCHCRMNGIKVKLVQLVLNWPWFGARKLCWKKCPSFGGDVILFKNFFFCSATPVPLLLLGPPFWSTTLLTGMTGISLHMQCAMASDFCCMAVSLKENNCFFRYGSNSTPLSD